MSKPEKNSLRESMYKHVYHILCEYRFNRTKTAKILCISIRGLRNHLNIMKTIGYNIYTKKEYYYGIINDDMQMVEPNGMTYHGFPTNEERIRCMDRGNR